MTIATDTRKGIIGIETEAFGADPSQIDKVYQFRYRVVTLDDVIPSHNDNLTPNPDYPSELQPRLRDRAASRTQIGNIAKNLNPRALLQDSGFIDTGPMIVGNDLVVESGNGRVLALRKASQDFPEQYVRYKKMLETMAEHFGIDKDKLAKIDTPVLVRERLSQVDRVKFAAEANVGAVMAMSPYEQALQDARRFSPNVVSTLEVGEEQTIDQALRMHSNDHIIKHFVSNIPATERASIADEKGAINQQGIERLKLAIFAKTYTGDAGKRLVRIFGESADPMVKSIENAMFASLPDMAKAEGLIDAKQRETDLSIAPDMAEVIDTYASLKATGMTIKDYLAQQAMFEERLNPFQKKLLEHLDDIARKPKLVREMLRDIAGKIVDAPAKGQIGMLGLEPLTKEATVYAVINRQKTELGKPTFQVATTPAKGKELEKPDTRGIESAGRLGQAVGLGAGEDTGLAARTSVQVGLARLGKESAQVKMLEEFGGAPGVGGKKETLIDVEAEKAKEVAKPLPGQIALKESIPKAEKGKSPWEKTALQYQMSIGVHQPWIAEISPWQMGQMSKRQKAEYQKKRSAEWQASADAKAEWRQKIIDAYDKGVINDTTPMTDEAREAISYIKRERREQTEKQAFDKAYVENRIKSATELKIGDRVFDLMTRTYGKVEKLYKKSARVKWEETSSRGKDTWTVNVLQLQRLSYDDLKEQVGKQEAKASMPVAPRISRAGKSIKMDREGKQFSVAEIKKRHLTRSVLSQRIDNARSHLITIDSDSPKVKLWIRDQGRADIRGIDTPSVRATVRPAKIPKGARISFSPGLRSVKRGQIYHTKASGVTLLSRHPLGRRRRR